MSERLLGICLAAYADRTFDEAIADAGRLGVDAVDLPTDSVFRLAATRPPPAQAARHLADAGIGVACVSNSRDAQLLLGPHDHHTDAVLAGSSAAKAAHARRAALEAIELAGALGAPLVRLLLGCPDYTAWLRWPGDDERDPWARNADALAAEIVPLSEAAARAGTSLCVEPHVKQVVFDASSWLLVTSMLRAEGVEVGMCFDPANVAALGVDPVDFLSSTGAVPRCLHAKDVERSQAALPPDGPGWVRYGPHPAIRFRAVPWGTLDWPGLLGHLDTIGFDGPVLVEHEDVLVGADAGLDGSLRFLRALGGGSPREPWW